MTNRKNFIAPVWWLAVMLVFQLLLLVIFFLSVRNYELQGMSFAHVYMTKGAYIAVIIGEGVFYWQYRKRILVRPFAWYHVVGMILAFIVFPLFQTLYPFWITYTVTPGNYGDAFATFNKIASVVFWTLFVVAHIFFAMLIIGGLGAEDDDEEEEEIESGQDILRPYEDPV